jgi:hypothetical protein
MFGASVLPERIGMSRRKTIESPGITDYTGGDLG